MGLTFKHAAPLISGRASGWEGAWTARSEGERIHQACPSAGVGASQGYGSRYGSLPTLFRMLIEDGGILQRILLPNHQELQQVLHDLLDPS